MRSLVATAALGLLILFPSDALSSCESLVWGARQTVEVLAADGTTLWVGGASSLESWDTADPLRPERMSRTALAGVDALSLTDGYVLALSKGRLLLLNEDGEITAEADAGATHLAAHEGYAVTASADLVRLWRVTSHSLTPLDSTAIQGGIESVAFDGRTVVASRGSRGIAAWDIASDAFVRPRTGAVAAREVVFAAGHGWAVTGASGLVRFDPVNLLAPAGGAIDAGLGDFIMIEASGNRLFVGDAAGFIHRYLIQGTSAVREASLRFPVAQFSAGEQALYASGDPRSRFGESLPAAERVAFFTTETFVRTGEISGSTVSLEGAAVAGDLIYIVDAPLLRTMEIRNGSLVEIATTSFGDASDTVRVEGGYAIVYGRGDVHLLSLHDPRDPHYLGVFRGLGTSPNDVAMAGDLLLEVNRGSGFHILDLADPAHPAQIGGMINDGYGQHHKIAATELAAYSAADAVVKVIDLRDLAALADPWEATYVTVLPHSGVVDLDTIPGTVPLLVIADGRDVAIYSLENPVDPALRATVELGQIEALRRIDGERAAIVALRNGGIVTLDLTIPSQPDATTVSENLLAFDVRSSAKWIVASTGESVVVLPREERTESMSALHVERAADGLILARWPGREEWLISFSAHEDMRDSETFGIGGEAAVISGDVDWTHARAFVAGCSQLSSAAVIQSEAATVIPLQRRVRMIGLPGSTTSATLQVLNRSAQQRVVEIETSSETIDLSTTTLELAAGARRALSISTELPATRTSETLMIDDERVDVVLDPIISTATPNTAPVDLVIPGVGNTAGARGTRWRSNLDLVCTSDEPCVTTLTWLRPEGHRQIDLTLAAGEAVLLEDIATLFGIEGTGAVAVRTEGAGRVEAGAVTWNDSEHGFYGQRIEAMSADAANRSNRWIVPALASHDAYRTNIGLVAPGTSTSATIFIRDMAGTLLSTQFIELPAGAARSIPVSVAGTGMIAEVAGDRLLAWASRVDQHTGDATFIAATPVLPAAEQLVHGTWIYRIDLAGRTPGAGGALWNTDLLITNPHDDPLEIRARWIPFEGHASEQRIEIPARGASAEIAEMMPALGLGSFIVESSAPIVPWGRAWIRSGPGTFGQFVPAATEPLSLPSPTARAERSVLFPVIANDQFRTNLAISTRDGVDDLAVISIRAVDGTLLTARSEPLSGWNTLLLSSVLQKWNIETDAAQIIVESNRGARSLASVVANATGDGVTVATD